MRPRPRPCRRGLEPAHGKDVIERDVELADARPRRRGINRVVAGLYHAGWIFVGGLDGE
jgi:hypothetical protein